MWKIDYIEWELFKLLILRKISLIHENYLNFISITIITIILYIYINYNIINIILSYNLIETKLLIYL